MKSDPVELALREITDTKRLVKSLLTSSETFDYIRARDPGGANENPAVGACRG